MPLYGPPLYGPQLYGTGGTVASSQDFVDEMEKKQDTTPFVLVEHIDISGTVTDISSYYLSGGNVSREKERAPDEIQAGDFDIELLNHDDYFSEYIATSLFYGVQYHLSKIRMSVGFILANGSTITEAQCIGYIDEIEADGGGSTVTLRCRDLIHRIIDEKLHLRPSEETPVAGGTNVGNGTMSSLETKPFKVVNENWTLTCTTPGADGVAIFSVVGSVSGDVGDATSGTEFSTGTGVGGIKFTITGGDTPWSLNDAFTFSTWQRPEWTQKNPIKIIWSILTGYNYDTGLAEAWADSVLDLDSTRDATNTDIDYASFVDAIGKSTGIVLTGYVDYNEDARDVLESLLLLFLGSLISDADGKIVVITYPPSIGGAVRSFMDSLKVTELGYTRSINEVINYVRMAYKKTDNWQFSGEDMVYDGWYVAKDTASIAKYGKLSEEYTTRWYMSSGTHAQDFAVKLLDRYAEPPLVISFTTGADGLLSEIGDKIYITDAKYGFSLAAAEISKISKNFDSSPLHVEISARRDTSMNTTYGYLGSSADEGDGISPQSLSWDTASDLDKQFAYLSQTGGGGPDYRMF